jgi:hypothetical protein
MAWIAGILAGQAALGIALSGVPTADRPAFWVLVAAVAVNVYVALRGLVRAVDDAGR